MGSYLHCGVCRRAFDAAAGATCPSCTPVRTPADRIAAAAQELAAALAGAAPAERAAVAEALGRALGIAPTPPLPPEPTLPVRTGWEVVERRSIVETLRRRVRETRSRALGVA